MHNRPLLQNLPRVCKQARSVLQCDKRSSSILSIVAVTPTQQAMAICTYRTLRNRQHCRGMHCDRNNALFAVQQLRSKHATARRYSTIARSVAAAAATIITQGSYMARVCVLVRNARSPELLLLCIALLRVIRRQGWCRRGDHVAHYCCSDPHSGGVRNRLSSSVTPRPPAKAFRN